MKLHRVLSMTLVLMMVLGLFACAQAQTTLLGSTTYKDMYLDLNQYNGVVSVQDKKTGYYKLVSADGQDLTTENYIYMRNKDCMFSVAVEPGMNTLGMIDATGKPVMPMQYGDVEFLSDRWQLGVKLVEATAENYDYKSTDGEFYLVEAYDVYFCGALAGTLGRLEYYSATPHGNYLYVRDLEGNYAYYDSALNRSAYETDYHSSSEYDDTRTGIFHRGSNQQAFVSGCTLTPDDVDTCYKVVDGYVIDLQGNKLGAVDPAYSTLVQEFHGDYATVSRLDRKKGMIDKNGNEVIPCEYDYINIGDEGFVCGAVIVTKDGKLGYVNANGQVTCEPKYAEAAWDSSYKAPLNSMTDLEGNVIVFSGAIGELPEKYAEVYTLDKCPLFIAKNLDGAFGVVDMYGQTVIPFDTTRDDCYDFTLAHDGSVVLAYNADRTYTVYSLELTDEVPAGIQVAAASGDSWTCACGTANEGKFCTECGAGRPAAEASEGWTCACGQQNTGKFCPECGSPRPAEKLVCQGCGYEPAEGTTPKFCPECGSAF